MSDIFHGSKFLDTSTRMGTFLRHLHVFLTHTLSQTRK